MIYDMITDQQLTTALHEWLVAAESCKFAHLHETTPIDQTPADHHWFNMSQFDTHTTCGTAHCIGGWVRWHTGWHVPMGNWHPVTDLWYPCASFMQPHDIPDYNTITIAHAIHAVRTYLDTGTPDWSPWLRDQGAIEENTQ